MSGAVTWIWQGYVANLRRYAVFAGRSRREELWAFGLVTATLVLLSMGFDRLAGLGDPRSFGLNRFVQMVHALPFMALGARRFHDLDRTAWWVLVPPAWIWAARLRGAPEATRFGSAPSGETGLQPPGTSERSEKAITDAFGVFSITGWFMPLSVGFVFCLEGGLLTVTGAASAPNGPWWAMIPFGITFVALGTMLLRIGRRRFRERGGRRAPDLADGPSQ